MKQLLLLLFVASLLMTSCDPAKDTTPQTTLTIASSSDVPVGDWPDRGLPVDYIVKIQVNFSSGIVNVGKNVTIQFDGANASFNITGSAAVKMIGTKDQPIILEGITPTKGTWKGVLLNSSSSENIWEYVTIRDAGSTVDGAIVMSSIVNQKPSISNCLITNNKGYGVYCNSSSTLFTKFSNNTISDNSNAPIFLHLNTIQSLDSNNILANNTNKFIELHTLSYQLDESAIWNKQDVPYRLKGLIIKKRLELRPGTKLEFLPNTLMVVGTASTEVPAAVLIANGTPTQPIFISGTVPNVAGQWEGVRVNSSSVEHVMNFCNIDGAGSVAGSCATFKSALTIGRRTSCTAILSKGSFTNLSITNSGGYGIAYRSSDNPVVSANSFSNCALANVFNF